MNTQTYTFNFPKHCDHDVMLRMVVMLMKVTQIDVSVWPGDCFVTEDEIVLFNTQHPDFVVPYMDIMNFCRMINIDNIVTLSNITVVPGSGTGIIVVSLSPKSLFVNLGG